jgi:hypothetical protein
MVPRAVVLNPRRFVSLPTFLLERIRPSVARLGGDEDVFIELAVLHYLGHTETTEEAAAFAEWFESYRVQQQNTFLGRL